MSDWWSGEGLERRVSDLVDVGGDNGNDFVEL